MLPSTV
jgi:hypothetical protein